MNILKKIVLSLALLSAPAWANQTIVIASGQTAVNSSAVTCNSACTFSIQGSGIPAGVNFPIYMRSNGVNLPTPIINLTSTNPVWSGQYPATYIVSRPNIAAYGVNVAFTVDQSATGGLGSLVDQGTPSSPSGAWPVISTDAGGVNQQAISASGAAKVDGSAVMQPVSGTFWQTTQPVSCAGCFPSGGSIGNTAFGISGTLPAFGATPTFNLGTLNGAALDSSLSTINTTLTGTTATAANQTTEISSLGSIVTNTTGLATAANQASSASILSTIATNTTGASTAANQTSTQKTIGSTKFNRSLSSGQNGLSAGAASYVSVSTGYTAYATPTDLSCLVGSSTKLVTISSSFLQVNSTTGILETVTWVKRSSLSTGTNTSPTIVPYNSADAAATAVVTQFGGTVSAGASVGTMSTQTSVTGLLTAAPTSYNFAQSLPIASLSSYSEPVTLQNANEELCINWGGAAWPTGGTATVMWQFTESTAP